METEIKKALEVFKSGGVVVYPTDTCWGIGCDATNEKAVLKLKSIIERPEQDGLVLLIAEIGQLYDYVVKIPEIVWDIIEFSEKPLTIIYPEGRQLPPYVLGADGSVAIRLVKDPFCQKVIQRLHKPLVATQAYIGSGKPPGSFAELDPLLSASADYLVDLRRSERCKIKHSTLMKLGLDGEVKFLRK
ncbi:MAG: L-threonylcarbamoyladenylate synthase [Cytophagaceae bacterium]